MNPAPAPPRPPPAATPRQQAAAAKAAAYAKQRADEIARVGIDPRTANGLETLVEEAGLGGGKGAVPRVLALERAVVLSLPRVLVRALAVALTPRVLVQGPRAALGSVLPGP